MALYALRLRRAISLSSSLLNHHLYRPIPFIPSPPSSSFSSTESRIPSALDFCSQTLLNQSRAFRSSPVCLARVRSFDRDNTESEIGPDTILFEGCDYNHWLITMDFPKDPKPTSEEMVETYVQTAAKIFGSVEEAKKKIYACSCTTYNGFQVLCDEATSEKFKELPGVVFVLPDSYIDPVNKEYGGDKYDNGVITHRPPPVQYGRVRPRYNDRNRDFNQSNRARRPYQQDYAARDNQGPMQADARNFGQQQYPSPQQNYGQQGAGQRRDSMPMNSASEGGDTYQGYRRDPMPSNQSGFNQGQRANYPQSGYNQGQQGNYHPQAGFNQGQQGNYHPPSGYNQGPQGNYHPPSGYNQGRQGNYHPQANYNQGQQGTYPPQANYYPGQQGNYHPQDQRAFVPGNAPAGTDNWNFTSPQEGRNGQALGGGYEQGTGSVPSSNVENHPEQGEQRYSPVDHRNSMPGEQRNYQYRD